MPLCLKAKQRLPIVVEVRDSLLAEEPEAASEHYDLVIGNPPYGRVPLAPEVRERYKRSLYGHANLYGVFTDLAIRFARTGGVIAYVTPTSFLAGEYFKALRALLASSARPVNIDFVSVRKGVFDDALQETMLATYRKTGVYLHLPTVHFIAPTEDDEITVEMGGDFELSKDGGPWLVPRTPEQGRLVATLREMPHRLSDYGYTVSTGPLVWNRHKDQLATKASKNTLPLIWAESVSADGSSSTVPTNAIIRPISNPKKAMIGSSPTSPASYYSGRPQKNSRDALLQQSCQRRSFASTALSSSKTTSI